MSSQNGCRSGRTANALTIDVEDYFQVSAMAPYVERVHWDGYPSRVSRNVRKAFELFDKTGVKATFFFLGWVAERFPDLVREASALGHEIGSHGYSHTRVSDQSPEEFFQDAKKTRVLLEDLIGKAVLGYRAASFSIDHRTPWAHDVLENAGYAYSSSIYPVNHDHYGMPDSPRFAHTVRKSGLLEIPLSTYRFAGRNWPIAGGGYFRLYPLAISKWAFNSLERQGRPVVFYFHPWELDPDQPRVAPVSWKVRFRHYVNLNRFEKRLHSILLSYNWGTIQEVFFSSSDPLSGHDNAEVRR